MYQSLRKRANKVGQAPGVLMHIGERKTEKTIVQQIEYDGDSFEELVIVDPAELSTAMATPTMTWINVVGLHQVDIIGQIGEAFGIHPLLLEDILNTNHHPKMEQHDQFIYIILRMLDWDDLASRIETEQISIVLGKSFVLTFQEQEEDVFNPLRQRIRSGKGRIRQTGSDFLAYSLLDLVVDHYFLVLEKMGDKIEEVELDLLTSPTPTTPQRIHDIKREILYLRKSVWPLREVLSELQRDNNELFDKETLFYLRDVYEHTIHVIDTVETFRDMVSGILDIYLSSVSNKMNEVMKVLTVIATIFIPLTFITGLYGMNFVHMPELEWRWGYLFVWLLIIAVSSSMLLYFRRKSWL